MKMKCISILLFALALTDHASGQTADTETVDRLTARAMKHLTTLSRFSYKTQLYTDLEFGKNFGFEAVEGYFGENAGLCRSTVVQIDPKSEKKYGLWVNGDQLIFTKKGDQGGTVIHRHHVPWATSSDAGHFAAFYNAMGLGHFVLYASAEKYARSLNPHSLPSGVRYALAVTEVTHRGRPCLKVVPTRESSSGPSTITSEYYLDKEHGMVLTKLQKGMLHIPKGSKSPSPLKVDQLTEITYGPPTENGLPFPTAVKGWFVWPTGRREPMTDIEFTEYRRYTPTADELDFEKQFGLPLPALPPKPGMLTSAGGSRISRWLIGGLALTTVAAAGVYLRLRWAAGRDRHDPTRATRAG